MTTCDYLESARVLLDREQVLGMAGGDRSSVSEWRWYETVNNGRQKTETE